MEHTMRATVILTIFVLRKGRKKQNFSKNFDKPGLLNEFPMKPRFLRKLTLFFQKCFVTGKTFGASTFKVSY